MPDFFDRLLARHAPTRAGTPADVPRLRPRLPGPFERAGTTEPGTPGPPGEPAPAPPPARTSGTPPVPAPLRPAATTAAAPPRAAAPAREHPAASAVRLVPARPLLVAPPLPPATTAPAESDRAPRRRLADARPGAVGRSAGPTARPPAPNASRTAAPGSAAPPAPAVRPRPPQRPAASAAPGDRRRRQPAERVVHVSIGRLEVTAAERRQDPPAPGGRAGTGRGGRPEPVMTLDRYLGGAKGQGA
ncbi:hypothetical protein GO002_26240 [Streptomyces eurocidicus]|uniref:Uncharacterized protein n=1 Tax=Streptomyces eurocidicus TaxID=66423 RepID=A0A7W8BES9_STREU|nr:hypothetical protein [Streptomyces eurocidicus]MBB5122010.1 hypothetical protein [Streptomyces eurocidicus]MBF6055346.1 hypothetical protein [Streptomyces eurocidicus]